MLKPGTVIVCEAKHYRIEKRIMWYEFPRASLTGAEARTFLIVYHIGYQANGANVYMTDKGELSVLNERDCVILKHLR